MKVISTNQFEHIVKWNSTTGHIGPVRLSKALPLVDEFGIIELDDIK